MIRALVAGLCLLALTACGAGGVGPTRAKSPDIRPDAEGIGIDGKSQRIDFGRTQESTIPAVSKLLGVQPGSVSINLECGAGPTTIVKYPQIDLLFLDGAFRGWVTSNPGTIAGNGLSPGVSRTQLNNGGYGPFEETTLGVEFASGGIFGLLPDGDANSPIRTLWSGTTCFFR